MENSHTNYRAIESMTSNLNPLYEIKSHIFTWLFTWKTLTLTIEL